MSGLSHAERRAASIRETLAWFGLDGSGLGAAQAAELATALKAWAPKRRVPTAADTRATVAEELSDLYGTDPRVYAYFNRVLGPFDLDAAASAENALAPRFLTAADDATMTDWAAACAELGRPPRVFCNPPYSAGNRERFFAQAVAMAERGVMSAFLVPATTGEGYFARHVFGKADLHFITGGRLNYVCPETKQIKTGANTASMVVAFQPEVVWGGRAPQTHTHGKADIYRQGAALLEARA